MKLVFSSIKNGTIFEPEFQNLTPSCGTIEFKHMHSPGGIAVVYAPNGTGKSSFSKILGSETTEDLSFSAVNDNGENVSSDNFHVIFDQINRNVIRGKETDYLVGQQIKREYALKDKINNSFNVAFSALCDKYKNEYKVSKVGDYLLKQIEMRADSFYSTAFSYLRSIVNNKDHGKSIEQTKFVNFIRNNINRLSDSNLDSEKRTWIINDCNGKSKIAKRIIELDYSSIVSSQETVQIERHDDAIGILKKYHLLETCVVCDNHDFHGDDLLEKKQSNRNRIYNDLAQGTKDLLDNVVRDENLALSDPFNIKKIISDFIAGGDDDKLITLKRELNDYVHLINDEMIYALTHCFEGTSLFQDFDEYTALVERQPQLDSEELLFIETIVSENIDKKITIKRDPNSKNYKLKLGDKDLIGTDRKSMELSSGEQNFISLAFELLLARHSEKEYVVLDDPISSFDSVYKNKIAYCIIRFLDKKKQIVLTHNTDLIRLLDVQLNKCFNLYILNNVENGNNGFVPVNEQEKGLLINLHELVKLLQNKCNRGEMLLISSIRNRRQFLMSMIPFMRGYAHISLDPDDDYGNLSDIMHGYGVGAIDVVPVYKKLFGYDFGGNEIISVTDVLGLDCDSIDILDETHFPLLAGTLKQSLIFYHIRMKVEKELVDAFGITAREMDTLNQIIRKAFPESRDSNEQNKKFRTFFTSRKTLLNEFNHFEGNMNIFQPAIDITQNALKKEISDIERELIEVRAYAASQST